MYNTRCTCGRGPKYLLQLSDQNTSWPKHLLTKIPPDNSYSLISPQFIRHVHKHYVISCLFRFIELYVQYTRSLVQRTSTGMYEYKYLLLRSVSTAPSAAFVIIQMQEMHYRVHSLLRRRPRRRPQRPFWRVIAEITPTRLPRSADAEKR